MNRCQAPSGALVASLALAALLVGGTAAAQTAPIPNTQNEAANGGRNFPVGTLRGSFMVVNAPQITLDSNPEQMAPGGHIFSATRMLVTPASITGQNLLVNYTRDAAGMVNNVWILTPGEADAQRATASSGKLLNFWPFVARSAPAPEPTPLTPYNQLPKYGQ